MIPDEAVVSDDIEEAIDTEVVMSGGDKAIGSEPIIDDEIEDEEEL